MNEVSTKPITVDEFLVWSARQERGRYKLQDGWVIMLAAAELGSCVSEGTHVNDYEGRN